MAAIPALPAAGPSQRGPWAQGVGTADTCSATALAVATFGAGPVATSSGDQQRQLISVARTYAVRGPSGSCSRPAPRQRLT